ncbi:hypothetical protein QYE76_027560 [Lolium multiflorum]|uniref:Protein kinase domain-containing protein n=1 Tax=Lolium multiflorum TaxID=4521 RepID=A0AAD8VDP7_LOLMU|nr:hypothetical protein QYE76_027560 [Lolium multiflorum]
MEVVAHCHSKGIVHRDLKPENILLVSRSPSSAIKLADFGLATYTQPGQRLSGTVGSPFYIAPEVLAGGYNEAADVWSSGVILYILLSGIPPFWGKTKSKIFECIRSTELRFPSDPWDRVSDSAKELITGMLRRDPRQRLTAEQVLGHSWIQEHADDSRESCGHCHEIGLRREEPGSCSFSTPLASHSRDVSFNTGVPITFQSLSEEPCSPTFACKSSFSAFAAASAPPASCAGSGFSFSDSPEPRKNVVFPLPVMSMPSFSFFCRLGSDETGPSAAPASDDKGAPCDNATTASSSLALKRTAEASLRGVATRANPSSRGAIGSGRRNHTIGSSEREHPLDTMVTESVIRWASCTHLSTTLSLRASLFRIPSNTMSSADAASSDDAKLQSFLQWLQANGADLRGCTIRACGRKGFGVYSAAAATDGNHHSSSFLPQSKVPAADQTGCRAGVVMVVPLDLAVTPMRVLQDPLVGPRCRALFEEGGVDDRLLVMLFLMAERLRPTSLWKPYLDMLPSTFGSSVWFDDEELAELEGTTLHRATVMQKRSLQKLFDDKVKGLVEELLQVDDSGSSIEVQFEDFLWANSIFWTRALNIPLPHSYVFPGSLDEQQTRTVGSLGDSGLTTQQESDTAVKNTRGDENSESCKTESIWVEGLVPGIDFCNHNVKALATWEVDSVGNATGIPASMYLRLAQVDKSSVETGTEIYINYGNKGNEELLYLYGFVVDNNPDDYLMVHYPIEALRQVQSADVKMRLIEMQKAELRCLLPTSLLDSGFFGTSTSSGEEDNKKNASHFSSYSWSGQRKVPSYLHKNVFPQEFLSTLRTIAMQEHELEQVASLLGEVGSSEDTEPSDAEIRSAIWEVCGDHGALGLLVDLLKVKMAELEEGTGTEASDGQLLEKFDSNDTEDSLSASAECNDKTKSRANSRSCIVYRRGQKQLTRAFLREAERLLELKEMGAEVGKATQQERRGVEQLVVAAAILAKTKLVP